MTANVEETLHECSSVAAQEERLQAFGSYPLVDELWAWRHAGVWGGMQNFRAQSLPSTSSQSFGEGQSTQLIQELVFSETARRPGQRALSRQGGSDRRFDLDGPCRVWSGR